MIWFRRIVALPLILIALVLFIVALVVTELNSTVANPGFYKDQLTKANMYNPTMEYAAEQVVDNLDTLPYTISLNETQVEEALKTIFPEEWITSQIGAAIDSVVPYATGDSDQFNVTIPVRDLADPTTDAIIELLATQQTYDYLREQVITPTVAKHLGSGVYLPFNVSLSQEEISSAIKQVLPQSWVHDRFEEIVRAFAAYVKGESENISVTINLTDSKAAASDVLTALVDQKLQAIFDTLPEVSMADFLQAIENLSPENPLNVRPEGASYDQFEAAINPSVTYWVNQMVIGQIPNQWSFTKDDLIKAMGADSNEKTLDDIRHYIANGYTINEVDLKDKISEGGGDISNIDRARDTINTVRTWLWVLWLVPLILLLCAGLLIARSLKGKVLWFLGLLFVVFLIFYIASGVGYSHFAEPEIQKILPNPADYQGMEAVMIDKGNEVANNAIGTFVSGIQSMALYTMIGSGVVFLGISVWSIVGRK